MEKEKTIAEFKDAIEKEGFYAYVQSAHQDGRLKDILPDVDKLFLVSEKTDDGKIDKVGAQVLSVLEKGDKLSARSKYALLTYNVSKSYTSKDLLPLHPLNYGKASARIIDRISSEIKVPDEYNEFAMMFARYHSLMDSPERMGDCEAYDLVQKCEAINGKDEFFACAQVYMEDKAERSSDSSYVRICANKSEKRLKDVFADVRSGNTARFTQAKMEETRQQRGW